MPYLLGSGAMVSLLSRLAMLRRQVANGPRRLPACNELHTLRLHTQDRSTRGNPVCRTFAANDAAKNLHTLRSWHIARSFLAQSGLLGCRIKETAAPAPQQGP